MRAKQLFVTGKEYGWLTILYETEKDSQSHRRFAVRCRCGKEYVVCSSILNKKEPKCWECSHRYDAGRREVVSDTDRNGWHIYDAAENYGNVLLYECRCLRCGKISYKTLSEIDASKSGLCQYCKPEYYFRIEGNTAEGTLPNGKTFLIDAELVPTVGQYYWRTNGKGYLVSGKGKEKLFLHRLVLGYTNRDDICIDHKNRVKSDCRRNNLRVVTVQQNSMNRSIGRNNTSGYVGVCLQTRKKRYFSKICLNNKSIWLGSSTSPIECAQRYNFASQILFGEFAGYRNDVPEIPENIQADVYRRIEPFISEAITVEQRR